MSVGGRGCSGGPRFKSIGSDERRLWPLRPVAREEAAAALRVEQLKLLRIEPQLCFSTLLGPAGGVEPSNDLDALAGPAQVGCAGILRELFQLTGGHPLAVDQKIGVVLGTQRQTDPDAETQRTALEACLAACRASAEECERHAPHHEHCRACAEECRRCERACGDLLAALTSA
jgi:hypothetical protein